MHEIRSLELEGRRYCAGIATTDEEVRATFRLRWQTYVAAEGEPPGPGQIRPTDVAPEHRARRHEVDWCDPHAIPLLVTRALPHDEPQIVGTARLIRASGGLLVERASFAGWSVELPLRVDRHDLLHRGNTVEGSRWIASPEWLPSGRRAPVSMMLVHAAVIACRSLGIDYIVNAVVERKMPAFRRVLRVSEIGPRGPHRYHGSDVSLCVLHVPRTEAELDGFEATIAVLWSSEDRPSFTPVEARS